MMSRRKLPARLQGAPDVLLNHAWRESGGDWSRVVYEDGAVTIHNHTTFTNHELPATTAEQNVFHLGPRARKMARAIGPDRSEDNMNSVFHRAHTRMRGAS